MSKTKKTVIIVILVIAGTALSLWACYARSIKQAKLSKQAEIEQMRADFEKYIPEKLPEYCIDLPYPGEVTASAESSWEDTVFTSPSGRIHWYKWQDTLTVTLHVDKAFDELSEREICDMLGSFSDRAESAYARVREEFFPEYDNKEYSDIREIDSYDLPVNRMGLIRHIRIRTPSNTYEHADTMRDYYTRNGRDVFIRDEKSRWKKPTPAPTPRPTSGPRVAKKPARASSKTKTEKTDPYEAHLYDDPDDYADRYAEEFAEEIGEDVDAGYDEAYDHWNYWHEMNDD